MRRSCDALHPPKDRGSNYCQQTEVKTSLDVSRPCWLQPGRTKRRGAAGMAVGALVRAVRSPQRIRAARRSKGPARASSFEQGEYHESSQRTGSPMDGWRVSQPGRRPGGHRRARPIGSGADHQRRRRRHRRQRDHRHGGKGHCRQDRAGEGLAGPDPA